MQDNRDDLYLNLRDAGVGEDVIGTQQDFKNFVTNEKNTRDLYKNLRDAGVGEDVIGTEDDFYNFVAPDFSGNKSSGTTKVGSAAQQVVNEYDQSAKDNAKAPEDLSAATAGAKIGGNISLTPAKPNNQQTAQPAVDNTAKSVMDASGTPVEQAKATGPKTQFVPSDPNYVQATPTAEALKKYPWMQPDQVYLWNKTTKEPVVSYFDENGQAVTDEDLQIKKAKSEITGQEDTEYMHPEAAALQLPNGNTRGVRLKKGALTQMADEIMRKEYGDNYLNTQFGRDGNVYTGAERRDLGAQQLYDGLNSDVRKARISFAVADDKGRSEILSRIKAKWGKVADETSLVNAVSDENAAKEDIDIVAQQNINDLNAEIQNISRQMDQRGAEIDNASSPFVDQTFNARDVDAKYRLLQSKLNYAQNALKSWENVKNSGSLDALAGFKDAVMDISAWDFGFSDLKNAVSLLTAKGKDKQELVNLYGRSAEAAKFEDKYNPDSYRYGKIAGASIPFALQFVGTGGGFKSIGSAVSKKATSIAEKYALEGLKKQVVKGLGVAVGDIARAYTMSGTVQGLNTISDILTRSAGELTVDKQGNYQLKSDEPLLKSIYKGVTASAIENYTEMLGERLNIGGNLMRMLPKIGLGRVSNAITKIGTQDWYKVCNNWLSRAGVNDFGGEVLEEEIGIVLNAALVGDNPLLKGSGGLLDVRTQKDILGGMLLSISSMRAGALAMYGVKKGVGSAFVKTLDMYDKMQLNQSDKGGQSIFGEGWTEIKDEIDNTPNDKVNTVIEKLAKEHPSKDEQSAIIDYAVKLLKTRGHNLGIAMASDGENDEGAQEEIKDMPDLSQPNAKYINKDDGMIHKASLYPDASDPTGAAKDVFIIKGNLVANEDGSINKDASDDTIIYIDGNGERHIASPDKFAAAYPPMSNDEVQQANEGGENEEAQTTGNYNKGDEVNINVNGINYTAIIQGKDGFENYNVYYEDEDGMMHPAKFTADQLNEMNGKSTVSNGQQADVQQQVEQTATEQPAQQEQTAQEEQKPAIPTDEKGNTLYHQVPVETTINDLYDGKLDDNEIKGFVDANINEADKQLEKINKKTPKIGTNKNEYLKKKQEWQKQIEDATRIRDYWNSVKGYIAKQTHTTPEEVKATQDELSGEAARREYQDMGGSVQQDAVSVASDFIRGAKITPESFKAETGYGTGEQRKFVGMIAKAENGGKSIDRLAEELVSYDNAEMNGSLFGGDTSSAKDAILSALQGAGTRGDLKQTNEAEEQDYVDARNAARDAQYMEQYGMTYEEYLAYEEQIMPTIWREYNNYDETAFNNMYAEEIEQLLKSRENDTTEEKSTDDRGNQVLPEQQVTEQRGSTGSQEQRTEAPVGVQGTVEDGVVPERTSEDRQEDGSVPDRTEEVESATEGLTSEDADNLLSAMEARAEVAPDIELTPTNWVEQFGEDGMVDTPIGKVKMGENQIAKLFTKGRSSQFGMIRPTLTNPDVIVEVPSSTDSANDVERPTSLLFIKAFLKNDGSKVYYFKSVTVKKDGLEVSVSSHLDRKKRVEDALKKGKLQYRFDGGAQTEHRPANVSVTTPLAGQGASNKGNATIGDQSVSDMENGTLASPQLVSSESKDSEKSTITSSLDEKIAEEGNKVDTNPTEGQKEAGNYKKGHVRIDGYDITIEQPKGSVRRGTDANGKKWEQKMNNTYGYIRGTEGVDGDHIDIFLSDNPTEGNVYVVDQVNPDGSFDEHKVMYGFNSAEEARAAYLSNYEEGWKGLGTITEVSKEEFKKWVNSSRRKTKPFAEYKSVNAIGAQNGEREVGKVSPEILSFRQKKIDELNAVKDEDVKKGPSAWYFDMPLLVSAKTKKSAISKMHQRREDDIQSINNGNIDWMYNAIKEKGLAGYEEASSVEEKPAEEKRTEYGANNKVISKERYEELKKRMIKKLGVKVRQSNDVVSEGSNTNEKTNDLYRFIGETGARNLDAAEEATTRLDNLSTARQMEQAYNDKKARIDKLRDSKPVEITGEEYKGKYDLNRDSAQDFILKNLRGEYTIADTGEKVTISKVGAKKVTSHSMGNNAHLKSIVAIPQLLENAIFIEETPNEKSNGKYDSYRYYVVGLKIGNEDYTARITIGVKNGEYYYDHYLTEIEKGNLIEIANGFIPTGDAPVPSYTKSKDTRLISLLQTNDQENARKIKLATGWERGADGKWKYETPDFEYHPNGDARQNDKYKESDWYKELYDLEERLFNGETLTDGETKRFDELSARVNAIRDNDRNTERIYLDDYVEDNELFKAYPELKQTKIDFVDLPNEEYSAKYNEEENRITVNQAKSIDDKSAIAHEVQHAIQHIEGFAQGSNVDNYNSVPTSENVINDIIDATDGHILDGGGFDNTPEGIFNALNRKTTYGTILRDYSSELDDIANKYGYETIFDLVNDIDKFKSRVEMYLSEAGEVEARNVEARINMTPEQRRQSLASETEDVARKDQLFIYDNLGVSARLGTGALTDSELSNANDPAGKMLGEPSRTPAQQRAFAERERQRMADRAREVADILNLDNVEIVTDASTLKGRRAKAKGFYSRDNGKIVIVVPNHVDMADIEQTVLHEAVAHYGLRKLFGKNFDTFLYNVYNNASKEVREKITQLAAKHNWDFATATEEYLASLAEKTNFEDLNASWWDKIKSLFLKLLHSIGLKGFTGVSLTDNELRYILWRSYENLKNPGRYRSIIDEAKDITMQNELRVGNYSAGNSEAVGKAAENGVVNIEDVNRRFNEELGRLTEENAQSVILNLGRPGNFLLASGLSDRPIKLYGNKLLKKMRKHGFTTSDVKNLPKEINNPIAVFKGSVENSFAILTELEINGNNVLASISVGKGNDIDFNIISSVYGKNGNSVVSWINDGKILYVNKEKALNYLRISAPIAEAQDNQELSSAANIVKNFENPSVGEENILYREAKKVEKKINSDWRDEYDKKLSTLWFKFTEAAQDAMRSVKILQDIIAKETSSPISDDENVYWRENRLSSVNKYEQEYYAENYFKPIVTAIANLVKYGARYNDKGKDIINSDNDILKYLIAKHGIERNNYFREREAMNARKPYEDQIKELQKQVEKGEIKEEDANKKIAKLQEQADKAEMKKRVDVLHKDYSGLTELFQDKKDFDTLASSYVSDFEKKFKTKPLWDAINRATKGTLRKAFVDGLISRESYENTAKMYEYYIPLRGWANDVASEKYNYIGGKGHSSKILEISHGRTSLADNPISKIGQMMQDAILQGNRNGMKQAVYNLAMNHDTSLLNIKRQWYQNMCTKDNPIWERVFPDLNSEMTAEQVAEEVEDFESRMRELKKEGKATQNRKGLILRLHTTKREEAQHRISVAINGKEYNIFVNGNPRAAQAINGELNDVDRYGSAVAKVNRFLSKIYTSVNPEFVVTNYQRDAGFAASIVASTEPLSYQKEWAKNMTKYNPITTGVYLSSLIKKAKTGNINPNNKAERYMQEFLSNGGETGFTNMLSADAYKKQIKRDIKSINSVVSLPKAARAVVAFTERANTVFEDATRYATYVTSREQGRTIDRSIRDAKEISLNFNTRGADGLPGDGFIYRFFRGLRRWMIFVNPSIQGLNKAGMAFRNHPLRSSMMIAGLPTLLGYALPAIMQAVVGGGDGDDDDKNVVESYKDLPKWVRRTNIAIPIGGNNFVTIPLSYELRVSYGLGEMMWEYGEGMIDGKEMAAETLLQLSDLLPVSLFNGTLAQSISPTIARPFVDIIQNRNFYGKKIYNDSQFIEGYPEYMKAYAGTPKWLVKSTEVLNNVMPKFGADVSDKYTPGLIDLNPAMIDYLLSSYLGGIYNFLSKGYKTISMIWDEDMRDIQNVPILSRNWKNSQSGNPYNSGDRYKTYMKEYDLSKQRFNGYKKEAKNDVPEFLNSLKDLLNTPSGKRMLMIDAYKRGGLDKLNQRIRDIDAYDNERYEGEKDALTKNVMR